MHPKEIELKALLEVTEAINSNLPEESLYKIFYFTCISHLQYKKIALVVYEDETSTKVNQGLSIGKDGLEYLSTLDLSKKIIELSPQDQLNGLGDVDVLIPVVHKDRVLAKILLGGVAENSENIITDFSFIQTLGNVMMVAIENKRLARKELRREALRKEMEIARKVQSLLFPKSLPDNEIISVFSSYLPHFSVGGDYYDYIPISNDEFLFCIADVSGKGVPAALIMSNFQAALRTLARQKVDLEKAIHELNHALIANSEGEHFITVFLGLYTHSKREIHYVNAGHNAPMLFSNGTLTELTKGTTILGAFDTLPFLASEKVTIGENALVFCYTDGITETVNDAEEEFGEERLSNFLAEHKDDELKQLHQDLILEIDGFKERQGYSDDLTILSLRFK